MARSAAPRPRVLSPLAIVRRNAVVRGVLGGNRAWLVVGGVAWGGRLLRRALGRTEEVAAVERLSPGQAIRIEAIAPPARRGRRRTTA